MKGVGFVPERFHGYRDPNAFRLHVRKSARINAKRNMWEAVLLLQVDEKHRVRDLILDDDHLGAELADEVKHADVMSERFNADGSCEVSVSLPLRRLGEIIGKLKGFDRFMENESA